jgi:uncharacterized protein (TIGR03086 family)
MPDPLEPSTPDLVQLLERTFDQSTRVLGHITTDQGSLPTPCDSFDVVTLADHMLFAAERVSAAGQRLPIPEPDTEPNGSTPAEIASAFDKTAGVALDAWRSPGAFDGEIALPFGTFPASVVAEIYVIEQATHAWDLAVALGARQLLDESLAESVLPIAQGAIRPEFRGDDPMPFGGEIDIDADSAPYDRLAAFMGRTPEVAS